MNREQRRRQAKCTASVVTDEQLELLGERTLDALDALERALNLQLAALAPHLDEGWTIDEAIGFLPDDQQDTARSIHAYARQLGIAP